MILFFIACGSSNKESEPAPSSSKATIESPKPIDKAKSVEKTLILIKEGDDDIAESIANALNYHKLQPTIIYAPTADNDFAETLNCSRVLAHAQENWRSIP